MKRALLLSLVLPGCGAPPTWNDDVQPLVERHCAACHAENRIAPFSLTSYEQAAPLASVLADAVGSGTMPPWPAAEGCQPYVGETRLTADEREVFRRWADGGAPAGDGPPKAITAPDAKLLPRVDFELRGVEPYAPRALLAADDYHCTPAEALPGRDVDLIGFDVVPDNARVVHHVFLFKSTPERVQQADDEEVGPGWTCFGGPGTGDFDLVAAWAPGTGPVVFPAGTGIRLGADEVLFLQIHYSGAPSEPDHTAAHLMFAEAPVERPAEIAVVVDTNFLIPAGARDHVFSYERAAPFSARVLGVGGHMHLLGKSMRVSLADECLVDIPRWDFHWQLFYFLDTQEGLPFPLGETLSVSCTFDNDGDAAIGFGDATSDEMCVAILYLAREP